MPQRVASARAESPDQDAVAETAYRKMMWRLMPFLVLCYLAAFVDRSNVGFAKLQFLHDLGFTEAIYGVGAGLFYLGYMLFEVPSNLHLARHGARATLLRIMVLWGLTSAAMAVMRTPLQFYGLRALLGAAEAGFFPGVLLYLTYWVPPQRRARFTSLFMMSIAISGVVGGPLAGLIMGSLDGWRDLRGWQWLFIIEGLPSCVLGVVAYFYLSDRPAQARWLSVDEKAAVAADLAPSVRPEPGRHGDILAALRDSRFFTITAMAFALFTSVSGVTLWLPTVLRNSGLSGVLQIGLLSAIPYSIGAVAQYLVGRSSDRRLERRIHAAIPALCGAVGWTLLPSVSTQPGLALAVMTLATAGTLAAMPPFWSLPPALLSGTAAAAGIALVSTVGSLGSFLSPMVIGWLAEKTGSLAAGQYYVAGILAVGALAIGVTAAPPPVAVLTVARTET